MYGKIAEDRAKHKNREKFTFLAHVLKYCLKLCLNLIPP